MHKAVELVDPVVKVVVGFVVIAGLSGVLGKSVWTMHGTGNMN